MNEAKNPPQKTNINIGKVESLVNVSDVHLNVSQEVIVTTEDKIRLCLSKHLNRMEKKKNWIAPLGILLTVIVTLSTSDFSDKLFKAATWQAVFVISGVVSFIWLIIAAKDAFKSEKTR